VWSKNESNPERYIYTLIGFDAKSQPCVDFLRAQEKTCPDSQQHKNYKLPSLVEQKITGHL